MAYCGTVAAQASNLSQSEPSPVMSFFGHPVGPHGSPFVMVVRKPKLGEGLKPVIFRH